MNLIQLSYLLCLFPIFTGANTETPTSSPSYLQYHKEINTAENWISQEAFKAALDGYESIFDTYDFVFLKDYKVAAQLALYLNEKPKAFEYITKGIAAGWELKALKKDKFLAPLQNEAEWKAIEQAYTSLRAKYISRIDEGTRKRVKKMYKKDQWKAFGALLRMSEKAREKYAIKKFAPHSESQIAHLIEILKNQAYPGEKLIGNDFWMSTILSHHNSIAKTYNKEDPLYPSIKTALLEAIEKGEMSPYEYAMIDDWYKAVTSARQAVGYGFLDSPKQSTLSQTNALRQKIGLRTIALRNKLVEVENSTGMNFHLPNWVPGKIEVAQD